VLKYYTICSIIFFKKALPEEILNLKKGKEIKSAYFCSQIGTTENSLYRWPKILSLHSRIRLCRRRKRYGLKVGLLGRSTRHTGNPQKMSFQENSTDIIAEGEGISKRAFAEPSASLRLCYRRASAFFPQSHRLRIPHLFIFFS